MTEATHIRIAFPTEEASGLDARRCPHFGHAGYYTIVDICGGSPASVTTIPNRVHDSEGCTGPVRVLAEHDVNVLVVTGIGGRPFAACRDVGIDVWRESSCETVADAVAAWNERALAPFDPDAVCSCSD